MGETFISQKMIALKNKERSYFHILAWGSEINSGFFFNSIYIYVYLDSSTEAY